VDRVERHRELGGDGGPVQLLTPALCPEGISHEEYMRITLAWLFPGISYAGFWLRVVDRPDRRRDHGASRLAFCFVPLFICQRWSPHGRLGAASRPSRIRLCSSDCSE